MGFGFIPDWITCFSIRKGAIAKPLSSYGWSFRMELMENQLEFTFPELQFIVRHDELN